MVIATQIKRAIGTVFDSNDITSGDGMNRLPAGTKIMVMREATSEEYLNYCKEVGAKRGYISPNEYYYLMSVD